MRRKLSFKGISEPRKQVYVDQERSPNYRDKDGRLYLVRCFACGDSYGRENWEFAVARGTCAYCGWMEKGKKFDSRGEKY
jgi:hypothetical protein